MFEDLKYFICLAIRYVAVNFFTFINVFVPCLFIVFGVFWSVKGGAIVPNFATSIYDFFYQLTKFGEFWSIFGGSKFTRNKQLNIAGRRKCF